MARRRRVCFYVDEQIYEALKLVAEYNGYADMSELIRVVLRQFLVELRRNGVVILPVAVAIPEAGVKGDERHVRGDAKTTG